MASYGGTISVSFSCSFLCYLLFPHNGSYHLSITPHLLARQGHQLSSTCSLALPVGSLVLLCLFFLLLSITFCIWVKCRRFLYVNGLFRHPECKFIKPSHCLRFDIDRTSQVIRVPTWPTSAVSPFFTGPTASVLTPSWYRNLLSYRVYWRCDVRTPPGLYFVGDWRSVYSRDKIV